MGFSLFTDLVTPTKYDIPDAPQLDINQELMDNNADNLASFEGAKELASKFNDFSSNELMRRLREAVPEFAGLQKQMASNLAAQLRGELTQSDLASAQREGAAGALGRGLSGQAGAAFNAYNVGKRQFEIQQSAQAQTPEWLRTVTSLTRAPMYDFSNVFMTPMQRASLSWQNKTTAWNVQNMKNQMAVQPDPWMKSLAGFGDSLLTAAASAYGMNPGQSNSQAQMAAGNQWGFGGGASPVTSGPNSAGYWGNSMGGGFNAGDAEVINKYGLNG